MKYLISSDWHIGSMYQDLDLVRDFCSRARKKDVGGVLLLGDVIDFGIKGSERFEQSQPPSQSIQLFKRIIKKYKLSNKVKLYLEGNHERRAFKDVGVCVKDFLDFPNCFYSSSIYSIKIGDTVALFGHNIGQGREFADYKRLSITYEYDIIVFAHLHTLNTRSFTCSKRNGIGKRYWARSGCLKHTSDWEKRKGWLVDRGYLELELDDDGKNVKLKVVSHNG